ncbi:MAG: DUF6316 family protein [Halioglobus sp.]|nr:DUF6316 family protein [Halioglobus sp.]
MGRRTDIEHRQGARSSRMYEEGGSWFFNTREGTVVGPFRDELEAYTQLEVYIRLADSDLLPTSEGVALSALRTRSANSNSAGP